MKLLLKSNPNRNSFYVTSIGCFRYILGFIKTHLINVDCNEPSQIHRQADRQTDGRTDTMIDKHFEVFHGLPVMANHSKNHHLASRHPSPRPKKGNGNNNQIISSNSSSRLEKEMNAKDASCLGKVKNSAREGGMGIVDTGKKYQVLNVPVQHKFTSSRSMHLNE